MDVNVILAIGVVITAITGLVTVILTYKTRSGVTEVRTIVNSRQDRMETRIEELSDTLRDANVAVPVAPVKEHK